MTDKRPHEGERNLMISLLPIIESHVEGGLSLPEVVEALSRLAGYTGCVALKEHTKESMLLLRRLNTRAFELGIKLGFQQVKERESSETPTVQ